jgi:filamentous hemagglutinin family protein
MRTLKTPHPSRKLAGAVAAALAALHAGAAFALDPSALPTNGRISSGSASIVQQGATTTVTQTSDRVVALWDTFNIGSAARVDFLQPSRSSVALNRVMTNDPSRIFGQLNANGQVFLVNPSGVLFGAGASVNVGSLVASSLDISDADFNAGRYLFARNGVAGAVVNQGNITAADGGYVALIGPQVRNEGGITAPRGAIALGAGDRVALDPQGDGLLSFEVQASALGAEVSNSGSLRAEGGLVQMSVRAADAALSTVLNQSGVVEARSLVDHNGVIRLDGGDSGVVAVSGRLDAAGAGTGATGGTVTVLGDKIGLFDGARIDVSGNAGGGTALVGGNWQGSGSEQHASAVYVDPNAVISADALERGNGGTVVVWSDDATRFYGAISARGGAAAGDGGRVETSGRNYLEAYGSVDASAAGGASGVWLLDPRNVTISGATANGAFDGATPTNSFTPTANTATVNAATINTSLNGGTNVTITTGSTGTQAGDITVASAISKTGGADATLRLVAADDVNVNANITSTSNKLNVVLQSATGGTTGAVSIGGGAQITTNGGNITVGGGGTAASGPTGPSLGGGTATANGFRMQGGGALLSAGAGNIVINAKGSGNSSGFSMATAGASTITTTSGSITISATGAGTGNGINITTGTNTISSTSGIITLTGTAPTSGDAITISGSGTNAITNVSGNIVLNGTSPSGSGVTLAASSGSARVEATGTGNIQITAQGSSSSQGFAMSGGSNTIRTGAGNISVTASNSGGSSFGMGSGTNTIESTGAGNITIASNATSASAGFGVTIGNGGTNRIHVTNGQLSITAQAANANSSSSSAISVGSGTNTLEATGAGSILLNGTANGGSGFAMNAGGTNNLRTTSGALTVTGNAAAGDGISLGSASTNNSISTSAGGNILLTGVSSGGGNGMTFATSTHTIQAAGAGNITINATASSTAGGLGFSMGTGGTSVVRVADGVLAINGQSASASSAISLGSGNNTVQATGAGSVVLTGNALGSGSGVILGSGGNNLVQTVSGALSLVGNAAGGDAVRASGNGNSTIKTATGTITLSGAAPSGDAIAFAPSGGLAQVLATGSGDIAFVGDTMNAASAGGAIQFAGNGGALIIRQRTPGTSIGIGDGSPGTLSWTGAEIALVQPGFSLIKIGDAQSGKISLAVPPGFPAPVVLPPTTLSDADREQQGVLTATLAGAGITAPPVPIEAIYREDGRLTLDFIAADETP